MQDVFEPEEAPKGETEAVQPATDATPPVAEPDKQVPLAALEAERGQRRDWKEKALRLEGELRGLRERSAPPQEQRQFDPIQALREEIVTERFNRSEQLVRQAHGNEKVDAAFETFKEAMAQNPALSVALSNDPHPWNFAFNEGMRIKASKEIGSDPAAYREKLRAELLAEMGQPVTRPVLPTSLAGARSSAARTAPGFSGPPAFDDIFK